MTKQTKTIAESNRFIVLDEYISKRDTGESYQSEGDLERELIDDLVKQGYEFLTDLKSQDDMLANVRVRLQALNDVEFTDDEWLRFVETYLDKSSEGTVEKTRKIHDDYIYDFVFDDGRIINIYLLDKKNICRNKVEVIKQFGQTGVHANRYDVTLLVNGLPLVQIELKKRGVAISEAFNQIHRYSKESFNSENSLYKYLQMFVISNGTDTRYFPNTKELKEKNFDFTMNWARSDKNNSLIKDLKDFTATFFQKNTLLNVLFHYSVFDVDKNLLIMRPYQIAATERILWKIKSSYEAKSWGQPKNGGYIWHTTGSGKTLTSYKAARQACELDFIDKVFFVVDRKDLDYQTMKEYQRFSPDSVSGSNSTRSLKRNLRNDDNKIIVTTIQKLNNLIKNENDLPVYNQQVVFIFDECHRSQFGESQKNLKKKFKRYYQFGFTGTPILPQNAQNASGNTTADVFGKKLHSYLITNAIRDEKVLKFKVDYNDVHPKFKDIETEQDLDKLNHLENKEALLHPERIKKISKYILNNFHRKTHRWAGTNQGFNAMFAVSSIDAAKHYYETLNELQEQSDKKLKIATIFSFTANEEPGSVGEIADETFDVSAMNSTAKEFLSAVINDYNGLLKTNFGLDDNGFEDYYRDLSMRVKNQEIDLLIVVGMFLTGFDAPRLNTLFVDKNLRYHGLLQAYSRTNRIYDATKKFGNIVTFRNLEKATIDAIKMFGDDADANIRNVVLERSYQEYMEGFTDEAAEKKQQGFVNIVKELGERFPNPSEIEKESDERDFVKLFGKYLKVENVLQNYDEFANLQALQQIDVNDEEAVETFKREHQLSEDAFEALKTVDTFTDREIQDYRSTYNDIHDRLRREKAEKEDFGNDWDGVVFEVDLLKSLEINLDYILELIFEHNKVQGETELENEVRRILRASISHRAKEDLILDFINQTDLDKIGDKADIIESFYQFAQEVQHREVEEIINSENLNVEAAKHYIRVSIKRGFASENGTELNDTLPKMSLLNPQYEGKRNKVLQKTSELVEKFKGFGKRED